jgi:3-methyladenine DNA glycosylase AlkC
MKNQNFEDEQHSGFDALKQLRGIYSDKEVINLLNTVSEKKKALQTTLNHDTHDLL